MNKVTYRVTDQQYRYSSVEHSAVSECHRRSNGKTVSQSCASQGKVGGKGMKTTCTEPRHTNGNPTVRINVGVGKPEDPSNEGDRATPHYVYCSGIRKRQAAEAPSYITTLSIPKREEQASRNPRVTTRQKSS